MSRLALAPRAGTDYLVSRPSGRLWKQAGMSLLQKSPTTECLAILGCAVLFSCWKARPWGVPPGNATTMSRARCTRGKCSTKIHIRWRIIHTPGWVLRCQRSVLGYPPDNENLSRIHQYIACQGAQFRRHDGTRAFGATMRSFSPRHVNHSRQVYPPGSAAKRVHWEKLLVL